MFERFTIDRLAAAIENEVKAAKPDPKLTRRFWCKGRRDGKRGRSTVAMRALISEAVRIASSKICEDFVAAKNALMVSVARVDGEIEVKHAGLGEAPPRPEAAPASLNPSSLKDALGALDHRRALAEHAKETEALRTTKSMIDDLRIQRSQLTEELAVLPVHVRQQINSCEGAGKYLWARYCTGYVVGLSRAKTATNDVEAPSTEIDFKCPCAVELEGNQKPSGSSPANHSEAGAVT